MKLLGGLLTGLLFGLGLALSGMTDSNRVLGFLDIFGAWQPALLFVMGSAVAVTFLLFPLLLKRGKPLMDQQYHLPAPRGIDTRLLVGAAIFGMGWGLYGYCPGPAITSLAYGDNNSYLFLLAMLIGMALATLLDRKEGA